MSSQEDINPDNFPDSAGFNKDVLFDPKPKPKIIRVLTVLAYVLSVSMAAIMLSIYYIFMWDGRPHIGARQGGGPESGHKSFSIPHQFTEIVVHSVGNITEHHHFTPSPNFIYITKRNTFSRVEKWKAETPVERKVEIVSLPSSFTDTFENDTENSTYHYGNTEMQQQFTDGNSEELRILPIVQTTTEISSPENTSWPRVRDYETIDEFSGASPFMKKLMDHRYDEDY